MTRREHNRICSRGSCAAALAPAWRIAAALDHPAHGHLLGCHGTGRTRSEARASLKRRLRTSLPPGTILERVT